MNDITTMVDELIAAGCSPAIAARVVTAAYLAGVQSVVDRDMSRDQSVTSRDMELDQRRESDRLRKQRSRDRHALSRDNRDMSRDVTNASLSKEGKKEEIKEEREVTPKSRHVTNRGHRLPDDWQPNPQDHSTSLEQIGAARVATEIEKFRDHWKQQPGTKGVKLDWDATWRNWIRRAAEYGASKNGRRTVHDAARDFHENILDQVARFDEPAPSGLCGGEGQDAFRLIPPGRRQ